MDIYIHPDTVLERGKGRLLADVGGDELVSAIPDRPVVLPP